MQLPNESDKPQSKITIDNFLLGIGIGLIIPLICFVLDEVIELDEKTGFRVKSIYLLGMIVNILLVRFYFRRHINNTGKGIFLASFLVVLAVFFFKK